MIKNFLSDEDDAAPIAQETSYRKKPEPAVIGLFDSVGDNEQPAGHATNHEDPADEPFTLSSAGQTSSETVRQSGLAYSLGIAFFVAVGFMMILGWGADLLFGSSPWGVVIGIVIGSLIGFYQLFRLSSHIFKK